MSTSLPPTRTVTEAWLGCLEEVISRGSRGQLIHVVTTVTDPGTEDAGIRRALDSFLAINDIPEVDTVAETIFPISLLPNSTQRWSPGLTAEEEAVILQDESSLYEMYLDMLEILLSADGNHSGTYFSRMISWPGKTAGGVNQLAERIGSLRSQRRNGRTTFNAIDMDLAADSDSGFSISSDLRGLQVYAATDRRTRGFPCLTHIDLTLFNGRLHMTAVYRHQYLVSKAYGNLMGLSWLLRFIADQSGFEAGELLVNATMADAEFNEIGRSRVTQLARALRAHLDEAHEQQDVVVRT